MQLGLRFRRGSFNRGRPHANRDHQMRRRLHFRGDGPQTVPEMLRQDPAEANNKNSEFPATNSKSKAPKHRGIKTVSTLFDQRKVHTQASRV